MKAFYKSTKPYIIFIFYSFLLMGCSSKTIKEDEIDEKNNKTILNEHYQSAYVKALRLLEDDNYPAAILELNKIMADNKSFSEGWANLALAELRAGNIDDAKKSVNNVSRQNPPSAALENLLGLIELENGAYKVAEKHYGRALELNPDYANAHYNLALLNDVYYQNLPVAIQHYERYLSLTNNTDPDTEVWVAELKRNLK